MSARHHPFLRPGIFNVNLPKRRFFFRLGGTIFPWFICFYTTFLENRKAALTRHTELLPHLTRIPLY